MKKSHTHSCKNHKKSNKKTQKKRVNVYIDGYNFYYPMMHKIRDSNSKRRKEHQRCNFRTLFSHFLKKWEILNRVYFFTAYKKWDKVGKKNQLTYISALNHYAISSVLWNYQYKTFAYLKKKNKVTTIRYWWKENCKHHLDMLWYKGYEEKETDVKMSVTIVADAFKNDFDHAYIVSWDSDIIPAIETVRAHIKSNVLPKKEFSSILVPWTKWYKIRKQCDHVYEIWGKHMEASIMPHRIDLKRGKSIEIPQEWLEE